MATKFLYLDNFRGFQDEFVPLEAVNFLVGENSSGKTSIIRAIKLLGDSNFWLNFDFNPAEFSFGHFKDLVSVGAEEILFEEVRTKGA
jgi:predicted ATP-dependent endonuclease of OLD family